MKDIAAIIPTKHQSDLLLPLIKTINKSGDVHVVLIPDAEKEDLGFDYYEPDPTFSITTSNHTTVYQKWNKGIQFVREQWPEIKNIAILNDDIIIDSHTLPVMANWLRFDDTVAVVYPDYSIFHDTHDYRLRYTTSTYGAGGMAGFCFMFKAELPIPLIDENFELYWGDDDFVKQVEKLGYKIARIEGLPITHGGSHTISKMDPKIRNAMMEKDRAYFQKKYGERREPVF